MSNDMSDPKHLLKERKDLKALVKEKDKIILPLEQCVEDRSLTEVNVCSQNSPP